MTLLAFTGFETGTLVETATIGGSPDVQSSVKRSGDYSLRSNAAAGQVMLRGLTAEGKPAELGRTAATYYSIWIRVDTLGAGARNPMLVRNSGGSSVAFVNLSAGGVITAGGATTSATAATITPNDGVWHRLDLMVLSNGASTISVDSGSAQTFTANNLTQDRLIVGGDSADTQVWYIDDVVIDDAGFPGSDYSIHRMDIDGAGTYTAWTGTYADMDEVPHDSDTSYVNSTGTSGAETGTLESAASAGITWTPRAVKSVAILKEASSTTTLAAVRLRSGSTDSDSTAADVGGTTYVAFQKLHVLNPDTSADWTLAALDSLEVGVVKGNDASDVRCTAAYVMVYAVEDTAPIITVNPAVTYVAGSTGVSTDYTQADVTFTATDVEDTGANELTWQIRTQASGAGLIVASGLCTSGVEEELEIPYYAPGLILGDQTLYLRVIDSYGLTDEESFSFFKFAEVLEGDFNLRVDLFDASGDAIEAGPLTNILQASYTAHLGQIGSFSFSVPADDARSTVLEDAHGYTAHIYRAGEGLVFKGLIDRIQDVITTDETKVREVSGSSVGRELVHANTYATALDNVSLSSAVTTLLTGTTWSSGSVGSPGINMTSRFDLRTVWDSLSQLALMSGYYLREDNINRAIDINAFGTNPYGLVFRNVEMVTQDLQDNRRMIPITGIRVLAESHDVWNRVVPIGQREGISGENLTLEAATRSSPYTVANAAAQDGSTYYYLEDSTSVTAYGRRVKPLLITKIVPLGIGANDEVRAANALYDNAAAWLARHKDPLTTYQVSVLGVRHLEDGYPLFEVGDKVKLQYRGVALDADGRRTYLDVDSDLFIMGYTRRLSDSTDAWSFEVATVARDPASDGAQIAEMVSQLQAVQATPISYILFGEGAGRLSDNGLELVSSTNLGVPEVPRVVAWGSADFLTRYGLIYAARNEGLNYNYIVGRTFADTDAQAYWGIRSADDTDWDSTLIVSQANGGFPIFEFTDFTVAGNIPYFNATKINGNHYEFAIWQGAESATLAALHAGGKAALTIAGGVIAIGGIGLLVVDTEAAAASDNLDTINANASYSLTAGKVIVVRAANSARTVVLTESGNMKLAGGTMSLDNAEDTIMLIYDGTNWLEIARSNNGA